MSCRNAPIRFIRNFRSAPGTLPEQMFDLLGYHFRGFLVNFCASRAVRHIEKEATEKL